MRYRIVSALGVLGQRSPWLLAVICFVVGLTLNPSTATASPIATLSILPSSTTASTGDTFALDVSIGDVSDLFAYQFDIAFDPSVLQASDIIEGDLLATGGTTFYLPGAIDNVLGNITFTANSLFGAISGVSGSGTLATIHFAAAAAGTSPISLSNVVLLDSGFADISAAFVDGSATVRAVDSPMPVPEPATLALIASGLVLASSRRRRA